MTNLEHLGLNGPKTDPESLLQAHLGLLHGETRLHREEEAEIAALQNIAWPDLPLKKPSRWIAAPLFLLAASIAMIVGRLPEQQSAVAIKGVTKIFAVVERGGKSKLMSKGERLESADRMNVEIIAGEHVKAFMGVFNRQGVLLSSTSDILANSLDIVAGKKGYFQTAIELTKENDGERVLVVTCLSDAWTKHFATPDLFTAEYFKILPLNSKVVDRGDGCQSEVIVLRD